MHYILTTLPIQGIAFLIWCVIPSHAATFFTGSSRELFPYFKIRCGFLECPYGYETDVEGSPICICHDPCKAVWCLNNTKCVVHKPKSCAWKPCKFVGECKDVGGKRRKKINLYTTPLGDAPTVKKSVCFLQLTEKAKDCKKQRKRWYFDPDTGKCRKFRGCRTGGNNFGRKKRCKRKCIRKRKSPRRKAGKVKNARRRVKQ